MDKLNLGMKACGVILLWAGTVVVLPAQTFTSLHSFDKTDGDLPSAGLVQATDGNLYGTTVLGGTSGLGVVFKITPSGTLSTLYNFCSRIGCVDGNGPHALVQAANGNFYGATVGGGRQNRGDGTVYEITPSGSLTTLYSFSPDGQAGYSPEGLIQATDGNLYGTTINGGTTDAGAAFKITPLGGLTTLRDLSWRNGANPVGGLIQATSGDFYGTGFEGGLSGFCTLTDGCGAVFRITALGALTTRYNFCSQPNCTDGSHPEAGLAQGNDGNFYGAAELGGGNGTCFDGAGCGTIFRLTPSGSLTTLHSFNGTDGAGPLAGLVQGSDGNFYGTTTYGGVNDSATCFNYGCGTVFQITPSGAFTTLYNFCSQGGSDCTDGAIPDAVLVQDTNGAFYGSTTAGGTNGNYGTVFSLSVGLGPFVETQQTAGTVGTIVAILGTSLTGSTSVTFNGTPATFRIKSQSEISATVSTGATMGPVEVVTPGGTLSSNVPFRVTP